MHQTPMTKEARSDSMARSIIKISRHYRLYLKRGSSMDNDSRLNQLQCLTKPLKRQYQRLNSMVADEVLVIMEAIVVEGVALLREEVEVEVNRATDLQTLADAAVVVVVEQLAAMADCPIDLSELAY